VRTDGNQEADMAVHLRREVIEGADAVAVVEQQVDKL
jgi:hypothetical protein